MAKLSLIIILFLCAYPETAHATQAHGGPEGLQVHQMAHLFFVFSLSLLIYWLKKWGLTISKGWRYIQYSAYLLIFWNLDAFATHWLDEQSSLIKIHRLAAMQLQITTAPGYEWLATVYYLAKLDHLLCVPALFMLFMGLRRLLHEPSAAEQFKGGGP
ncbi:MAG: hypothetical protein P8X55_13040 [Desulfosarcinaceae bacterium]